VCVGDDGGVVVVGIGDGDDAVSELCVDDDGGVTVVLVSLV